MSVSPWCEALSEAHLQTLVTDTCDLMKLRWHHETDSRKSKPGFPDLVIVGPGGTLFRELKKQHGRVRKDQKDWLEDLTKAGADAAIWRPSDWENQSIYQQLNQLRRKEN